MAYNTLKGSIRNTTLPCFLARLTNTLSNVTGDGTQYTALIDTSVFDQTSSYNTGTGLFTAPVTGRYLFSCGVLMTGMGSGHTSTIVRLVTTARTYRGIVCNPFACKDGSSNLAYNFGAVVDMSSGDTASINVLVSGSTKTISLTGDATNAPNFFSGYLIC